jgi:hypothetical protein
MSAGRRYLGVCRAILKAFFLTLAAMSLFPVALVIRFFCGAAPDLQEPRRAVHAAESITS